MNPVLDCDSYKSSHHLIFPLDLEGATYYFEARSGGEYNETCFFGLQYILLEHLKRRVTVEDVLGAEDFLREHGEPFPTDGWLKIARHHQGRLPVRIRAVPEGTVVPCGNVLMTVESTDPDLPWLPGWLETQLVRTWYPTTVATRSLHAKRIIKAYLEETGDSQDNLLRFRLHDFGSRGVSSQESAMIGGAAHLVNFEGSDTVAGVCCAQKYYNCRMPAYSVPAAEHSTILAWGKDHEAEAYAHILQTFAEPGAIISVVSDTYDIDYAIDKLWGKDLMEQVKQSGGLLVIRLDSGDPPTAVVGAFRKLSQTFGATRNSKGFLVLNGVRLLQGDGLDDESSIKAILEACKVAGISTENIATLGMGGGLLQKLNRDTCRFAYKPCRVKRGGVWYPVRKEVKSDPTKASKAGDLDLIQVTDREGKMKYTTVDRDAKREEHLAQALHGRDIKSELVEVFENGFVLKEWSLAEIRERAGKGL